MAKWHRLVTWVSMTSLSLVMVVRKRLTLICGDKPARTLPAYR